MGLQCAAVWRHFAKPLPEPGRSCKNAELFARAAALHRGPEPAEKTAAKLALTGSLMDIERINTIGTTLADLTARTDALRGYL